MSYSVEIGEVNIEVYDDEVSNIDNRPVRQPIYTKS